MDIKKVLNAWISNRAIVIVLLIVFFPIGLYCMWKGEHFSTTVRWVITAFLAWWGWNLLQGNPQTYSGQKCAAVQMDNGCTYYRDDSCNVISRSCR